MEAESQLRPPLPTASAAAPQDRSSELRPPLPTASAAAPTTGPASRMNTKRKKIVEDELLNVLETFNEETDGDKLFLMGLLPDMKKLEPERRTELKMRIFRLVAEAVYDS